RLAGSRVVWSLTHQAYQVEGAPAHTPLGIVPESPAWFAWLDGISSFAFWGRSAHFTARKELRPRGVGYWYAYLGGGAKLSKRYLGKTGDLTLSRLEGIAGELLATWGQRRVPSATADSAAAVLDAESTRDSGSSDQPGSRHDEVPEPRDPLLVTKLRVPQPRAHAVPRSRLLKRLERGLESPLTLVSAPAGFGKTTLLAAWLAESRRPCAWLALEASDTEPMRFF